MATIYSAPTGFEAPKMSFINFNRDEWAKTEKDYLERLSTFCKNRNPNDPDYVGQVIKFPAADGYALYMVAALKPVQLIHIELMDAYSFQYANRLTKKDVMAEVDREKGIRELFAKKQN